jgi:hypothetical protein
MCGALDEILAHAEAAAKPAGAVQAQVPASRGDQVAVGGAGGGGEVVDRGVELRRGERADRAAQLGDPEGEPETKPAR